MEERPMALDPQVQAVIEMVARSGRPAYHTLSPKDARQLFLETRPAATPTPPEIGRVRNLVAETAQGTIPLRLYRPAGVPDATPLPAYVYFHGGGWVIGDLETHDVLCRQLTAASGASVISVDYRLAPEHKFPAPAADAWAATRWIVAHAGELGLDLGRLAVGGDSAGGNLAAVVALMARDAGGPAIRQQVLIYPVTDVMRETRTYADFAEGYMLTRDSMRWFIGHYLRSKEDARDWRVSPLRAPSLGGLPPALIVTAGFDPLRDEGEMYAGRLRDAGVMVDYVCYGGMVHGFAGMGKLIDTAHRAVSLIGDSLRQALR
jgi:acetyl esterase/lipase